MKLYDYYLSGPMTGYPLNNFPAFDFAAKVLRATGPSVFNPAENPRMETREDYMIYDVAALLLSRYLVALDGWEVSRGALCEVVVALEMGIPVLSADTLEPLNVEHYFGVETDYGDYHSDIVNGGPVVEQDPETNGFGYELTEWLDFGGYEEMDPPAKVLEEPKPAPSILEEAQAACHGPRRAEYGHPLDNHTRTAGYWTGYLHNQYGSKGPVELTPEDVCMLNILQKIARGHQSIIRDTLTDIAGYAANIEMVQEERKVRETRVG